MENKQTVEQKRAVWQRVDPTLQPYPPQQSTTQPAVQQPVQQSVDVCCMGTAAQEDIDVIRGFIEEELSDRRSYLACAASAPTPAARQLMRRLAAEEGGHARRLMGVHYLITGQCYRPAVRHGSVCVGQWCAALRERYHLEACSGFNYARAADGTTDPCLSRLFNELSADEYRHADTILRLLERSLPG